MAKIQVNLNDIEDFRSPSPGKHRAKLLETAEEESKSGNDMITWKWQIVGGEDDGLTIKSYTSLLDNALSGLKNHLTAFGFSGAADVDTLKLHGKHAILIVTHRKYRDRDTDEEKDGASVKNVLPDGDVAPPAGQTKTRVRRTSGGGGVDPKMPF